MKRSVSGYVSGYGRADTGVNTMISAILVQRARKQLKM
jgi:hypothetical protein